MLGKHDPYKEIHIYGPSATSKGMSVAEIKSQDVDSDCLYDQRSCIQANAINTDSTPVTRERPRRQIV